MNSILLVFFGLSILFGIINGLSTVSHGGRSDNLLDFLLNGNK